jgi:hypothetical protein
MLRRTFRDAVRVRRRLHRAHTPNDKNDDTGRIQRLLRKRRGRGMLPQGSSGLPLSAKKHRGLFRSAVLSLSVEN